MSRLGRRYRSTAPDTEIDMVPVMNMFLVLIPFLLMSASFLHLKSINTSVPVQSESAASSRAPAVKVMVIVELTPDAVVLSASSAQLAAERLAALGGSWKLAGDGPEAAAAQLTRRLEVVKRAYPASDTVLVIPHPEVLYETIIETMDAARVCDSGPLFPNVVLSGKVG